MNKLRAFSLGYMVVLLCVATAYSQTASLHGSVSDRETGDKLVGANIVLTSDDAESKITGTASGVNGDFEIDGITPGTYTVTVTYIGYEAEVLENTTFSAGETREITLALVPGAFEAEQVVVSASRRREKVLESPASVSVLETAQIRERQVMTPIDHVIGMAGVDVVKTGLNQSNVVIRGFNNVFSGAMLTIVDNRIGRVPSLRLNAYNFISTSNDDIERIEIVRGPGSALYGPNSANGVMHIITKSPFGSEGTTVSVAGGERSVFTGTFRHAGSVNNRFGYKVSFNYLRGNDFEYVDPFEVATRAAVLDGGGDPGKIAQRDYDIEKIAGDARVDMRLTDDLTLIVNGGFNQATSIELTGLGAGQAKNWTYSYVQSRLLYKNLFMQAFGNFSDAGDTYTLRDGEAIVDKSKLLAYQIQHGFSLGDRQNFTYGFDALWTRPETKGTVNGINEDDDNINEYGVYLQSETKLSELFKLVAAGRYDDHNHLSDPFFSPRAGLVFTPNSDNTFRLTFNRAFSTPTPVNLFLDKIVSPASLSQPFNIRVRGVPETGFSFRRDDNGGIGGLYMQPLFTSPADFIPADATLMWPVIVGILAQQGIDISAFPAPTAASVGTVLRTLNTTTGTFDPTNPTSVVNIKDLESTKTNTLEAGYKGIFGRKFLATVDFFYSKITDFIGPLRVETPNVFLDPVTLGAYLSNPLFGLPPANVALLTEAIAKIPVGTIKPTEVIYPSDLMLTYRNFGDINLSGIDLSFTYYINRNWNLSGAYSYVSKDFFKEDISPIALNAPQHKAAGALQFIDPRTGFEGQIRVRYVDAFPMNSGVFIGNVDDFTVFDLNAGIDLPFEVNTRLTVTVQNIFDNMHREFVGAPEIGRLALLRFQYIY